MNHRGSTIDVRLLVFHLERSTARRPEEHSGPTHRGRSDRSRLIPYDAIAPDERGVRVPNAA
jgi:hypothetical protein